MAKQSIDLIREAEQAAQETVSRAQAQAEEIIAAAREQAARQAAEMVQNARQSAEEALEASREEGRRLTQQDAGKYEEECRAVRAAAQKKQDEAARLVIKRITE